MSAQTGSVARKYRFKSLAKEPLDAVTRSIAESDASVAKAKKIRQDEHSKIGPRHYQVAETATRPELFEETVHDKVKGTNSERS